MFKHALSRPLVREARQAEREARDRLGVVVRLGGVSGPGVVNALRNLRQARSLHQTAAGLALSRLSGTKKHHEK